MILVLLGTFKIEFPRPVQAIEKALLSGGIKEQVIVQAGHTSYSPTSTMMEIRKFIAPQELEELYRQAEVIVTHAGEGSILKGVSMGKTLIAVPRLEKFKEHVDDHQLDILEEFAGKNYLIAWNEHDRFETILEKARKFKPEPFISNKQDIVDYLIGYIDSLN